MPSLHPTEFDLKFEEQVFDLEDWVQTLEKIHWLEYLKLDRGLEIGPRDIERLQALNKGIGQAVEKFRA